MPRSLPRLLAVGALALAGGACRSAPLAVAPVPEGPSITASTAVAAAEPGVSQADERFIRGMLAHHAQALVMTAMVPTHTTTDVLPLLAERIEVSQRDEIASMTRWLADQGLPVPATAPHAGPDMAGHDMAGHGMAGHDMGGDHAAMPGMLTAAQLDSLDAARGAEFDRLFLRYMIQHHEGALVMVEALLGAPGGAQGSQLFQIASEIDADQRAEIRRMRLLLARVEGR